MLKSVVMFYRIKCPKDNFRAESQSNINNAICLNALIRFWLLWNSIWAFLGMQNWFKYFMVAKSNGERYVTHSQSLDHSLSDLPTSRDKSIVFGVLRNKWGRSHLSLNRRIGTPWWRLSHFILRNNLNQIHLKMNS